MQQLECESNSITCMSCLYVHVYGNKVIYLSIYLCMCGAATCDLNHIMTSCTHVGEIPSKDDIAEMEGRAVRWMSAVADTI